MWTGQKIPVSFFKSILAQVMHYTSCIALSLERGNCRALEADFVWYNIGIGEGNQGQVQEQGLAHPA